MLLDLDTITSECKAGARGCVACKKELAANLINFLKPIKEKRRYYEQNPQEVDKILLDGTREAKQKAEETMSKVKKAIKTIITKFTLFLLLFPFL